MVVKDYNVPPSPPMSQRALERYFDILVRMHRNRKYLLAETKPVTCVESKPLSYKTSEVI